MITDPRKPDSELARGCAYVVMLGAFLIIFWWLLIWGTLTIWNAVMG